jgi:hypothetical protein
MAVDTQKPTDHARITVLTRINVVSGVCADLDEDCAGVCDKRACWMHDETKGVCPFLVGQGVK